MRHLGTLIAAIVIAPLAWILLALGQGRSAEAFADAESAGIFHTGDFMQPLQFLAAAGLLLGLIATLRFSPLGALLTGVVYVSSYVPVLLAPKGLLKLFGHDVSFAGHHADLTVPIRNGTSLLLGTLLLVGVFSIGRWRRWPRPRLADYDSFDSAADWDRPLGADGLGLTPTGSRIEPEMAVRYTTRRTPAMSGRTHSSWASPPDTFEEGPW